MENEEQTSSEPSQPQPRSSSTRMVVMGVLLVAMVVMALIQSGARSKRDAAEKRVDELADSYDDNLPTDYMKAAGKIPRVVATEDLLTQVYRWEGVLQHFEMRILFNVSDGEYALNDIRSSAVSRFKAKDISKFAMAEKSGTNNKEFPKASKMSKEGETGGEGKGGGFNRSDPPGGGPSGGPGAGGSRGGGMNSERMKERMVASFEKLGLAEAQQAKVNAIIEIQLEETMALLGGSREGMREKFGALREKYTAQFKEVLSEEQFEAYEKARDDARKQRGGGRGGGGAAAPPRPGGPPEPGK